MHNRNFIVVGAALVVSLGQAASAFSGGFDAGTGSEGGALSLPVIMEFDDHARDTASQTGADGTPDASAREAARPAAPLSDNEQFQRYFDRHYRAHLALDAAAPHKARIE